MAGTPIENRSHTMKSLFRATFLTALMAAPAFASADFSFEPAAPKAGETVRFTDRASVGPIPKNRWHWDFGDGSQSTEPNPTHVYTKAGNYLVYFSVWYANPASPEPQVARKVVTVTSQAEPLQAAFDVSRNPTVRERVTFVDRSSGDPTSWQWNFGDGSTSTTQLATHVYSQPGTYSVTLKVTRSEPRGESTVTKNIVVAAAAARVFISAPPRGMIQPAGVATAFDSFSITNFGDAAATVNIQQSGNFFVIGKTTATLEAKSRETIFLRALAQPAGAYEGSVTVSGPAGSVTLPIRLLSAVPPSGSVVPQPLRSRVEISGPAGENPSGVVVFRNNGTATLQGVAISDSPWIVPQTGVISIPPRETGVIRFTIDRSRRPDAGETRGALSGKLSLIYLRGASGKHTIDGNSTTPSGSSSITLVDAVKPPTSASAPPPLAAGETAIFIPGITARDGALGDIHIASSADPTSNVKFFFISSDASNVATITPPPAGSGLSLVGVASTVFAAPSAIGGVQIRAANLDRIDVGALLYATSENGNFGTALPVFRFTASSSPSAQQTLTGIRKDASNQTNVHLQEVSGTAAQVTVTRHDARGIPLGTALSQNVPSFGFVELRDFATAETAMIRISSTGGKILAAASVVDNTTRDLGAIVDTTVAQTASSYFLPVLPPFQSSAPTQTDVVITNPQVSGSLAVTVRLDAPSVSRRRGARSMNLVAAEKSFAVAPLETITIADVMTQLDQPSTSSGVVTISSTAPFVASSRTTARPPFGFTLATDLPLLTSSKGLLPQATKRFAGIDAASATSIAEKSSGTFRTSLALAETSNASATVRLTLRYTFSAGLAAGTTASTRDFQVDAKRILMIEDLASAVIGPDRDSYGDLRDMQLEVTNVGSGGRVVPIVRTVDVQSGDGLTRID